MATPRSLYVEQCSVFNCKQNTGVVRMLPDNATGFLDIVALDFSLNCVGRHGVLPVLEVARRCPNLHSISLADNYLNNDSVKHVCSYLNGKPSLHSIDLSKNPISHPSGKLLSAWVMQNANITSLNIDKTLMNPGLANIIRKKVGVRVADAETVEEGGATVAADGTSLGPVVDAPPTAADREVVAALQPELLRPPPDADAPNRSESPEVRPARPVSATLRILLGAAPEEGDEFVGLRLLKEANEERAVAHTRGSSSVRKSVNPDDDWYAMETIWQLAAKSSQPADGWAGLASVMALVRKDTTALPPTAPK
jgi:hypothetical protein